MRVTSFPALRYALAAVAALSAGSPQALEVRCAYTRRIVCGAAKCRPVTPIEGAHPFLLSPPLATIDSAAFASDDSVRKVTLRRCDDKGCTDVEVTVASDGLYRDFSAPGYMAKVVVVANPLSGESVGNFVEVATIFLVTEVNYGRCPFKASP